MNKGKKPRNRITAADDDDRFEPKELRKHLQFKDQAQSELKQHKPIHISMANELDEYHWRMWKHSA